MHLRSNNDEAGAPGDPLGVPVLQTLDGYRYWTLAGESCWVTLESRPAYCDRGRFIAKLQPHGDLALEIDGQDAWPRYYFDFDRAVAEIEAWLRCRKQIP